MGLFQDPRDIFKTFDVKERNEYRYLKVSAIRELLEKE